MALEIWLYSEYFCYLFDYFMSSIDFLTLEISFLFFTKFMHNILLIYSF